LWVTRQNFRTEQSRRVLAPKPGSDNVCFGQNLDVGGTRPSFGRAFRFLEALPEAAIVQRAVV
jgi:hypothetical protein